MPALGHALAAGYTINALAIRASGRRLALLVGQRIDGLLDEVRETQREITLRPAVTLQDAAVMLRRLSVYTFRPGAREAAGRGAGGCGEGGGASAVSYPHYCPANVGFRG